MNTSYGYDSLSHLLSVLHQAGSTVLDGASYTYDSAGNRLSKTNYLNGVTSNYGYDPLYELTQVTQGASTTESYSYDAVGNRLSSLTVPNYNYNVSNELTSNSNGSCTYDANGSTLTDASGKGYTWDFENRLTQTVVPGGNGGTTTFKYDPFGRRIQKSGQLVTTNYLYDGVNPIEEVNGAGTTLSKYTQTQVLDEQLSQLEYGVTSYYETDGLGSITSISNSAGQISNTYAYDSFGNVTASSVTLPNSFQYTGREADLETGLYYYRARYQDPTIGRFLSEDPAEDDLNLYAYVQNNPTNFVDPLGLYTTKNKNIPWPSPALGQFLNCLEGCIGVPIVVTSTTTGKHQDPGHAAGTSVDIRPPAGVPAGTVFCCAGKCGAAWGLNENPSQGGQSFQNTQGANYHFQLKPPNHKSPKAPNAIPPDCKPNGCSQK